MPLNGQIITIQDPGLGTVQPAATIPVRVGPASGGTTAVNTFDTVTSHKQVQEKVGYGPLGSSLSECLAVAGGPAYFVRSAAVAGSNGAVTQTGADPVITLSGSPNDRYDAKIEITATGILGAGAFRYSLDGGKSYGPARTIPAGGAYLMVNTGVTLTFPAGTYTTGNVYSFASVAPSVDGAGVTAAFVAIAASKLAFSTINLCAEFATAATANTVAGTFTTELKNLENKFRFVRGLMQSGLDTAAITIATLTVEDTRYAPCYGSARRPNAAGVEGFAMPMLPAVDVVGARVADTLPSTDLKRVASGSLVGVTEISYDEFTKQEGLDGKGFTTLRTWANRGGFYITNGNIKAPPGSDFNRIHRGRVMDIALTTTYEAQALFVGRSVRTISGGFIDPRDAKQLEQEVLAKLQSALLAPVNAEGTRGYVSEVTYLIDLTNNVLATNTILANLAIRPLGYVDFINTTVGYTTA